MQRTLTNLVLREQASDFIFGCLTRGDSCALVGLSNMGKSSLLRALAALDDAAIAKRVPGDGAHLPLFVYVDCNLMLEVSGRGFYEAILRALLERLERHGVNAELLATVRARHARIVDAENTFQVSLNFNEAVAAVAEGLERMVVLLLDEFDEAFIHLDGRVFLNLRALDDKYGDRIVYITATQHPLPVLREGPDSSIDEFCELFNQHVYFVGQFDAAETARLVTALATHKNLTLSDEERQFVQLQAGGHPGLVMAVVQALIQDGAVPAEMRAQNFALIETRLDSDDHVRLECMKLWGSLKEPEQELVLAAISGPVERDDAPRVQSLIARGMLAETAEGLRIPGRLLASFVRRQRRLRQDVPAGVWIDVEAGDVWVDGRPLQSLTDLEYRLLLLLYGRMEKICDKYQIVEAVWGQDYLDEVDDARIEKLVSRVRNKIESDPQNPRYLLTVRGRGYKLMRG